MNIYYEKKSCEYNYANITIREWTRKNWIFKNHLITTLLMYFTFVGFVIRFM
jgi:hypothetical protein